MVEILRNTKDLAPISEQVVISEKPQAFEEEADATAKSGVPARADKKHRKETVGEMLVERGIFTGVGFGVNEIGSIAGAVQFEHGKNLIEKTPFRNTPLKHLGDAFSHKGFERVSEWMAEKFPARFKEKVVKGITYSPKKNAGNLLMTATLLMGGTLLVWPMKALKDNESYLVKKANHVVDSIKGNKLTEQQVIERDKEVEEAIASKPKQSWPSLIVGRAVAAGSTMIFGQYIMGAERNDWVKAKSNKYISAGAMKINAMLGGKKASLIGKSLDNKESLFHKAAALTGVETIYCLISSIILEGGANFMAKSKKEVSVPVHCAPDKDKTVVTHDNDSANQSKFSENVKPQQANFLKKQDFASHEKQIVARRQSASAETLAPAI